MPMPSSVVIDPYNDEAVPAIWPCGSIARDVKLANITPNEDIIRADRAMNSGSGRLGIFTDSSMIRATATEPTCTSASLRHVHAHTTQQRAPPQPNPTVHHKHDEEAAPLRQQQHHLTYRRCDHWHGDK